MYEIELRAAGGSEGTPRAFAGLPALTAESREDQVGDRYVGDVEEMSASQINISLIFPAILKVRTMRQSTLGFVLLLGLSEMVYVALLRLDAINGIRPVGIFLALMGGAFVLYGAAWRLVRRDPCGCHPAVIVAGAILFRATLLPAGLPPDLSAREKLSAMAADWRGVAVTYERFLLFDNDVWRYLWDGHVAASGRNPYAFRPNDVALDHLATAGAAGSPDWDTIRENVSYPEIGTIYPPLAQMGFWWANRLAPGSVLAMKLMVTSFDLAAFGLLALTLRALGQSPARCLLYGWNPLVIKVFAGSGHIDAILVAALACTCYFLARGRNSAAAVSLGFAIASKIAPVVLLPFLARRVGGKRAFLACVTAMACFLPYLSAGPRLFDGFMSFSSGWQFNSGPFRLLVSLAALFSAHPSVPARAACGVLAATVLLWLYCRDDGEPATFAGFSVAALGTVLIFSPVVMPWYLTWLLPCGVLSSNRISILASGAVCLAFFVMVRGVEWPWVPAVEYLALGGMIWWEVRQGRISLSAPGGGIR